MDPISLPSHRETSANRLSDEDCIRLLRAFHVLPHGRIFSFQLLTGLTTSEILALRVDGIHWSEGRITIDRFAFPGSHFSRSVIQSSHRSRLARTIYLPDDAWKILSLEADSLEKRRKEAGAAWHNSHDLLFTDDQGGPVSSELVRWELNYDRKKICNIPYTARTGIDNFCVRAVERGIPPLQLQQYLGLKTPHALSRYYNRVSSGVSSPGTEASVPESDFYHRLTESEISNMSVLPVKPYQKPSIKASSNRMPLCQIVANLLSSNRYTVLMMDETGRQIGDEEFQENLKQLLLSIAKDSEESSSQQKPTQKREEEPR